MRVFLAGATGVIGAPLITQLQAAGHEVIALARTEEKAAALRARGCETAIADGFDAAAVRDAVVAARPEVVIHQLTALPARMNPRRLPEAIEPTNRLREITTPYFLDAARAAGARRAIFQSISWITVPQGDWVHDETAPVDRDAWRAVTAMEDAVTTAEGVEGVVLRYGAFYGPRTYYGPGGSIAEDVARRRFPVVGAGTGRTSFVHVDDAAAATVLALDRGPSGADGVLNVCDDDPAPMHDWVPGLAQAMGAKPPHRVPLWLARLAAGPLAVGSTQIQRANSNAKARRELGWAPRHPSWRTGFATLF